MVRRLQLFGLATLVVVCLLWCGAIVWWAPGAVGAIDAGAFAAPTSDSSDPASAADGYSVTLSPVGEVAFARPPRRSVALDSNYDDMLVALGRQDALVGAGFPLPFAELYEQFDGAAPGYDEQRLTYLFAHGGGFDKELFYALDADVHHIDPLRLANMPHWGPADVAEIARNVGPFFANRYSRTDSYPGAEPYTFYTLWELSAKVGQVYQREEAIAELKRIGEAMLARIHEKLPPPEQRPRVAVVLIDHHKQQFLPFSITRGGFGTEHYRAVGAQDACAEVAHLAFADAGRGTWLDVEAMLALDPEVLIVPFAAYRPPATDQPWLEQPWLEQLRDDPLASRIAAVRDGRIHPGGTPLQGPLVVLFQIEMTAKQLYPELFGPFRSDHRYPESEQLFDRAQVVQTLARNSRR